VLDVEVIGSSDLPEESLRRLVAIALASAGVEDGHLAVEFVDAERIAALNAEHRAVEGPTDVLSFPVDLDGENTIPPTPRELGDVLICPEYTEDLAEAVVHGTLHLVGMDHETDRGEMLALQAEILSWVK
jgi:probable rRNA maturation factor